MTSKNEINKIIRDNFKFNEKLDELNVFKNEINLKNIDNSFVQLYSLQMLIQKHSGLKELCKNIYLILTLIHNVCVHSYK